MRNTASFRSPRQRWCYVGLSVLLATLLVLAAFAWTGASSRAAGTATTTASLNLRAAPSTNADVLRVLPAGATVILAGPSENAFLAVSYQGTDGWAAAQYLALAPPSPAPSPTASRQPSPSPSPAASLGPATPAASPVASPHPSPTPGPGLSGTATVIEAVNLRGAPNTGSDTLAVMPAGASVRLTGKAQNGFVSVSYQGRPGWAASAYLNKSGASGPEHWIDVARGAGKVTLHVGTKAVATYRGYMSADRSNDGFYATALGTYRVYAMNVDLTWTPYGDVYIRDWVGFDPDRDNGFHSYPMDANGTIVPGAAGPSHGCVRLAPADADAVYAFSYIGMRVVVHW